MYDFIGFIEEMELIDVPLNYKRFTWFFFLMAYQFLLFGGLISEWNVSGQWVGDRDISDHYSMWLMCSAKYWGLKPFKFINGWLDHDELCDYVAQQCKGFCVTCLS